MISKGYRPTTEFGKKPPILSCDPATLGVDATERKCMASKNVIKLHSTADFTHISFWGGGRLWYVRPMSSLPPPRPFHIYGTRDRKTAFGATDFLRSSDRLAALLPNAMRMGKLQKDVRLILPPMYTACEVMSLQEGALTLAVPSSAVAAKLKQQLPKLQGALQKRGWQVEAVRIKIRMGSSVPVREGNQPSSLKLTPKAVEAFEELGQTLEDTAQNAPLIAAIRRLAEKRRKQG